MNNLNLIKILSENKLTKQSNILKEDSKSELIEDFAEELEYIWKMGKYDSPIDFKRKAESLMIYVVQAAKSIDI